MANTKQVTLDPGRVEHDYNLNALAEACDEEEIEDMTVETTKTRHDHTPPFPCNSNSNKEIRRARAENENH